MDQDQGETTSDRGRDHPSGRVRIIGADRVGEPIAPEGTTPAGGDEQPEPVFVFEPADQQPEDEGTPELPHWTEAPTGELPAVLARHAQASEDPWTTVPEPTWREDNADWAAEEDRFDASMLRADDEPFPNLAGTEDRQPWAFELDDPADEDAGPWPEGPGEAGSLDVPDDDDLTAVLPVVVEELAEAAEEEDGDDLPAGRTWRTRRPGDETGERRRLSGGDPFGPSGLAGAASSGVPRPGGFPGMRLPGGGQAGARRASGARYAAGQGSVEDDEGRSGRNLSAAIGSGLVIGILALIAFHFGSVPSLLVVTIVIGLAATEAFAAFRRGGYHPATLPGLVAVVGVVVASYNKGPQAVPLVLVLLVAATFLWHLTGVDRRAEPVRSTAATLFVFAWVGVFGAYGGLLLAPSAFPDRHGIAYLLGALVTAVAYDVGAFAIGRWVGRHPLSQVSPNKTWEGLLGGAFSSIVAAVIVVHFVHPWTLGKAVVLGIVVAVVMPIGDLGESLVKRHLGLKDMGRILPGHGGLLDRVDGLLFVLPATYYLVKAFHLG